MTAATAATAAGRFLIQMISIIIGVPEFVCNISELIQNNIQLSYKLSGDYYTLTRSRLT